MANDHAESKGDPDRDERDPDTEDERGEDIAKDQRRNGDRSGCQPLKRPCLGLPGKITGVTAVAVKKSVMASRPDTRNGSDANRFPTVKARKRKKGIRRPKMTTGPLT